MGFGMPISIFSPLPVFSYSKYFFFALESGFDYTVLSPPIRSLALVSSSLAYLILTFLPHSRLGFLKSNHSCIFIPSPEVVYKVVFSAA